MRVISFSFLMLFVFSCDALLCGELDKGQKAMVESAASQFRDYCDVDVIPCEGYYINIKLKQEEDPELTSKLHEVLYSVQEKTGWLSLHIFDKHGSFLITHNYSGKRSTVAPNW
ncbi:MAG: hypothetical protein AAFO07_03200 [Bacteroidota bacterium]